MLLSDDAEALERARFLATQARDSAPWYQHTVLGWNYRLSNVLAAIGRGQMLHLDERVAARRRIFGRYAETLGSIEGVRFMPEPSWSRSNRWLTVAEVKEDLAEARRMYGYIEKIFLADGDALCLSMSKLEDIIGYINELFTETKSINIYASPKDVLAKSQQDLERLHALGVKILYIGAESGNDKILKNINKGATRDEIIEAVRKTESSGIKASVTFIQGLGGEAMYREHAIDTGRPRHHAQTGRCTPPASALRHQ